MDPYSTASVNPVVIDHLDFITAQKHKSEAIPIDAGFLEQLESWGAIKDGDFSKLINVYDVSRDGEIMLRDSDLVTNQAAHLSQLPELSMSQTRIYLIDLESIQPSQNMPSKPIQLHELSLGDRLLGSGSLVHEEGDKESHLQFETIQARTFDVWNLKSLWRSEMINRNTNHFCLQTNVLESLLYDPSHLVESPDQSRLVLFFGRYTIEFWQSLSSVRTELLGDGRVEGKRQS